MDERYYQVIDPRSFAERLAIAAREQIYADFKTFCRPRIGETILDVGVSDVINDVANPLERKYPFPTVITAAGLGDGTDFKAAYPKVNYRQIEANQPLPFADKQFDIVTANAVLQVVGSVSNQAAFIAELIRVGRKIFVTVPHRYFPVEHHTAIPLAHYSDRAFSFVCQTLGKTEWTGDSNLILMSKDRLRAALPLTALGVVGYTGIGLGPCSSNLFLYIDGRAPLSGGGHD